MSVREPWFAALQVFEDALNDDLGATIVAISELPEDQLVRVVEAAQLVDREGRSHGDGWFDWNDLHRPFDANEIITLVEPPHPDAPDYAAGEVGDYSEGPARG